MTRRDHKRIVRELVEGYKARLLKNVSHFPRHWDGRHIRALLVELVQSELGFDCVRTAAREMRRSDRWFFLPL